MSNGLSGDEAARLRDLEDRAAIAALINRYGEGVRLDDAGIVASCFAEDGKIFIDHGPGQVLRGREAILRFYERKREMPATRAAADFDQFVATTPFISNIVIELDGDTAHCESMCLVVKVGYMGGAGSVVMRGTRNVDDLVREHNEWKIARRSHPAVWSFEVPGSPLQSANQEGPGGGPSPTSTP